MPRHSARATLGTGGFTLVEALIGVSVMSILGLVIAGMFRGALVSYNLTMRQTAALTAARATLEAALHGRGKAPLKAAVRYYALDAKGKVIAVDGPAKAGFVTATVADTYYAGTRLGKTR